MEVHYLGHKDFYLTISDGSSGNILVELRYGIENDSLCVYGHFDNSLKEEVYDLIQELRDILQEGD